MAKAPNWTKEEVDYLKLVWEDINIDVKHIENKLGRKRQTLSAKARKLGLSRGHNSVFSLEEIETLKMYYPIMSAKELKENFFNDKTEYQITNAGYNHKIKKTEEYLMQKRIEIGLLNLENIDIKSGENHPSWVERLEINCDTCGKPIKRLQLRISETNYCCRECFNKSKVQSFSMENNPKWNGGLSDIKKFGRSSLLEWKKDSMANCNYRCSITNDKSFEIHHIIPYNRIFDEVKLELPFIKENTSINYYTNEQLIEISNMIISKHYEYPLGICLRKDIHILFHEIYGRVDFGIDELNEFLNKIKIDEQGELIWQEDLLN